MRDAASAFQAASSPGTTSSSNSRSPRTTVNLTGRADALADHEPLQLVHPADRLAVDGDDQVAGPQSGQRRRRVLHRPRAPRRRARGPARAPAAAAAAAARRRCRGRRGGSGRRAIRAPTIRRVAELIGTASPRPMPATAVLMPTTRARLSASAPPELPGFRAASVWITLSTMRTVAPERVGSERPSAETTPAVTEPAKPFGLPIATTSCPTRRALGVAELGGARGRPRRRAARRGRERVGADDLEREVAPVRERGAARRISSVRRRARR